MKPNKLSKMLASESKGMEKAYGTKGILTKLFRQMLQDLNIGPARFGKYLQDYIMDSRYGVPNNKKDQTSMRGNLVKDFSKPEMSWNVFCNALRFLQIVKIEFAVKAYHANGQTSLHSVVANFGKRSDTAEFQKQLNQEDSSYIPEYVQCLDPEPLPDNHPHNIIKESV